VVSEYVLHVGMNSWSQKKMGQLILAALIIHTIHEPKYHVMALHGLTTVLCIVLY
jgi:hypothetical protein